MYFQNSAFNPHQGKLNLRELSIQTKKGDIYEYVTEKTYSSFTYENKNAYLATFRGMNGIEITFLFVRVDIEGVSGYILSNFTTNGKPTERFHQLYRKILGLPKVESEEMSALRKIVGQATTMKKYDDARITYRQYEHPIQLSEKMLAELSLLTGKVRKKKTVHLIPDILLYNSGTPEAMIEYENTKHEPEHFLEKLYKIAVKPTKPKRVYFIFKDEKNQRHHLNLFRRFEKETGRDLTSKGIRFTTINEFMFRGEHSFELYQKEHRKARGPKK